MLSKMDSAQSSLDVCMYLISFQHFADALIRAKDRGCRVRLITSRELEDTRTILLQIRKAGIMVRTMALPPSELLHMKLVIVDKKSALTGSVNYTVSGFSGNAEEVVCYNNPKLVVQYVEWFQFRWEDFSYADRMMALIKNHNKIPSFESCLDMRPV